MATMTKAQLKFIAELAELGGPVARNNNLPVSAMLACASVESGWGTGFIFLHTKNPFSLQKWPHVLFPRTHETYWHTTVIDKDTKKTRRAPFNCAIDSADAARQWCQWILHYGEADGPPGNQDPKALQVPVRSAITRRNELLGHRNNPVEFAKNLPKVGFGKTQADGIIYAQRLTNFSMDVYD